MKENEDNDRKTRISQHESHTLRIPHFGERNMSPYETLAQRYESRTSQRDTGTGGCLRKVKVHCVRPNENILLNHRIALLPDATWAETTKQVYKNFRLEKIVDLDQCRLVAYDEYNHEIVASYEGRENETFESIWNNRINSLLLEIRDKDKKFESYPRGSILSYTSTHRS